MSIIRSIARVLGRSALLVVLAVVAIAFAPIWIPWLVVFAIRAAWRDRRFMRSCCGRTYLVWHARRGWYDFVRNNLLPVLPSEVAPLEDRRHGGPELRALRDALNRREMFEVSRPFVVLVGRRDLFVRSLNTELCARKRQARRDAGMQAHVRAVVARALKTCTRLRNEQMRNV